jgi:hypothetical protein
LIAAYAESIQTVFIIAAPIGCLAFLAAWLIPHVELRKGVATPSSPATAAATSTPGAELLEQLEPLAPSAGNRAAPTELA